MRVLIAEDDHASRLLATSILRSAGHEVEQAVDGLEALESARRLPPDVLVTDVLMPRMDGYRLVLAWKRDVVLAQVPIIMVSASYTDSEDEQLARDLGVEEFLLKPVNPDALLHAVAQAPSFRTRALPKPFSFESVEDALETYSDRLVSKLETKLAELGSANERLESAMRRMSASADARDPLRNALAVVDPQAAEVVAVVADALLRPIGQARAALAVASQEGADPTSIKSAIVAAEHQLDRARAIAEGLTGQSGASQS